MSEAVAAGPAASSGAVAVETGRPGRGQRAMKARRLLVLRVVVLVLASAFFLMPFLSMLEFSTRTIGIPDPRTLQAYRDISTYPTLVDGIVTISSGVPKPVPVFDFTSTNARNP